MPASPTRRAARHLPDQHLRQIVDIDLVGVFLTCRAVVPLMRRQGYGRIVNIASLAGKEGTPMPPPTVPPRPA
ncbi:MAG: SDR family NAD(P)-dependent oxidoreductase [Geminicoccaceae bacterium]